MGKHYTVVVADSVTAMDWVPGYEAAVPAIVARHGGRYVAQAAADNFERMEGDGELPIGIVILEWPSAGAAHAFFADPEYEPRRRARLTHTTGVSYLVEGREDD